MIPRNPTSGSPTVDPGLGDLELPDGPLVRAGPLLEHAHRLVDLAVRLEVAEQQDRVGQVADVDLAHPADHQPVLGDDHDRDHPLLVEVGEQLVQVGDEEPLLGHGVHVPVQAVDDDHLRPALDDPPDLVGEGPGGQLGGVDLLGVEEPVGLVLPEPARRAPGRASRTGRTGCR